MTEIENQVRTTVAEYLAEFGELTREPDGRMSLPAGSSRVFIQVGTHPNGNSTVIDIFAPVLLNAPASAELYQMIATNDSFVYGRLVAVQAGEENVSVVMNHRLHGDSVNKDALLYAVGGIAVSANETAGVLQEKFGGETFTGQ